MSSLISHLQSLVQEAVGGTRGVTRRRVLASDGWFASGKLFALVNRQARVVVRLSDSLAQDELLALEGAEPWKIGNKAPMRGWLLLPESMHDDAEAMAVWLHRARKLAATEAVKPASRGKRRPAKKSAARE